MLFSCLKSVRTFPVRLFVLISVFALASCGGGGGSSSGTNAGTTVSSDATLSALSISSGTLSPSFSSGTTGYSDSVGSTVASVTVNASTTDSNATIKVNGTTMVSGSNSGPISLAVGTNTISVVVTAQDGTTTKTYSIAVTLAASNDATLSALSISSGTLSPGFSSSVISYSDTVANSVASVTVNASTTDSDATLSVNSGSTASGTNSAVVSLGVGSTSIPVTVTSQDGSTTKTYTITVKRLPALSALSLTNASLDQSFQSTQLNYTSTVNFLVNAIGVTATTNDSGDSLTIDSNSATSGTLFSPVYLATGSSNTVATKVTSSDGQASQTYNIAVTRNSSLTQQEYNAPDAAMNADFGISIAISGNTMVVGADLWVKSGATSSTGAAYVYTYDTNSASWTYQTTLTANSPASGDNFGHSVAIDGSTIVVGAPYQDTAAFNAGAVYVFTGSGANWTQQAKLTAADAAMLDRFGTSVSVSGNTLVVGSPFHTGGGAAYVFVNTGSSGSGWATATQTKLTGSNLGTNDLFGNSVAINKNTVIVGAPSHVINSNVTGAAYVFTGSGTSWTEQPMLSASNGVGGDQFGQTVAVSGNTIAVGATGVSSGTGAVYVFYNDGTGWAQQGSDLQASNPGTGDAFGYSIALSGERLVVGADTETGTSASQSGAAYVFMRNNTNNTISWSQTAYLKAIDAAASDYFGSSVGIDNDKLVIGARNKTVTTSAGAQTGAGVVYTFQ